MPNSRVVSVRRVCQKSEYDCGVASLAMATGRSYRHIKRIVLKGRKAVHSERSLITNPKDLLRVLRHERFTRRRKRFPRDGSPKWATLDRLCLVSVNRADNGIYHWVVYSRGEVWDPYPDFKGRRRDFRGLHPTGQYIEVDCNVE